MNASVGVNPIAPRFLAGTKLDGVTRWCPCNYCLWPNPSAEEWAKHMNEYHFPFAGNLQHQPIKWVWIIREVRDADHPLDVYFICESVEKKAEAPKVAEKKKDNLRKPLAKRQERQEINRAFRPSVCKKCGTRHFQWETGICKKALAKKNEDLDVEAPDTNERG